MHVGNYGSTREPVLTAIERVALLVSGKFRWADESYKSIPEGTNQESKGYLRGYRDAMREVQQQVDRTKSLMMKKENA